MPLVICFDMFSKRLATLEVQSREFVVTSRPYPVQFDDAIDVSVNLVSGRLSTNIIAFVDGMDTAAFPQGGTLRAQLQTATVSAEGMDIGGAQIDGGVLRQLLKSYVSPWEGLDVAQLPTGGVLKAELIKYENWPADGLDVGSTVTAGALS